MGKSVQFHVWLSCTCAFLQTGSAAMEERGSVRGSVTVSCPVVMHSAMQQ